jgi:hypothetical protein
LHFLCGIECWIFLNEFISHLNFFHYKLFNILAHLLMGSFFWHLIFRTHYIFRILILYPMNN